MTWVRLDDEFPEHPKVLKVGHAGLALYVSGLCYCSRNLTDGFIPTEVLHRLTDIPGTELQDVLERLVGARLWKRVRGGFRVSNYDAWQRTKAEVEAEREGTRERVKRHRVKRRSNGVTSPSDVEAETDNNPPKSPQGGTEVVCIRCQGSGIYETGELSGIFADCDCKYQRRSG